MNIDNEQDIEVAYSAEPIKQPEWERLLQYWDIVEQTHPENVRYHKDEVIVQYHQLMVKMPNGALLVIVDLASLPLLGSEDSYDQHTE